MDMITGVSIPRFRTTARLVTWMRRNRVRERVPAEIEQVFFKSKESQDRISHNIRVYAGYVGEISDELESLILDSHVASYIAVTHRRGVQFKESLLNRLSVPHLLYVSQYSGRLRDHEHKIVSPSDVAEYASNVGPLSEEMERRLYGDPTAIMRYFKVLGSHFQKPPGHLVDAMVGHDGCFVELAGMVGRLPRHLEESITDPYVVLNYARSVVKGRLSEKVETVLERNPAVAAAYAINVVRAWSNPRLPDSLHAAVLLNAGNAGEEIRKYIAEVDRYSKEWE